MKTPVDLAPLVRRLTGDDQEIHAGQRMSFPARTILVRVDVADRVRDGEVLAVRAGQVYVQWREKDSLHLGWLPFDAVRTLSVAA